MSPRIRIRKDYDGLSKFFKQERDNAEPTPEIRNSRNSEKLDVTPEDSVQYSKKTNFLSKADILSQIPDEKLENAINRYRETLRELEIERDLRSRYNRHVNGNDQFLNSRFRIGSFRFHSPESFSVDTFHEFDYCGFKKEKRKQGNKITTFERHSLNLNKKLKKFARSLTSLRDEERAILLREWEDLLNG